MGVARSTNAKKPTGPAEEVEQPMLPIEAPRRQRNRIGKKTIAGKFDPAIARAFAILAVKEDTTIEAMLTEAVLDILQKYKQPIER
uniref:ribbon-helix-helix domain-containing protein n=1 Tax=Sphingomonas sp. TaxID=28214 RepID=UPI00215DA5F2|nr:ribbon-helix-helix domain-containing protein [Sphingomonas sp.]